MKHLSPEARRLFELARQEDEPENETLWRVERSLAGRLASGVGVTALSALWTKTATGILMSTKWIGVTVVVGAASVVGIRAMQSPALKSTAATVVHGKPAALAASGPREIASPSAVVAEDAPIDDRPAARESAVNRNLARPTSNASITAVEPLEPPDRLREETHALRMAQQALRAGNAERALMLLDDQDRTFQPGQLQEERSAARVLALCQGGRVDQARTEAARFEQRWPRSALLARIRSSCF